MNQVRGRKSWEWQENEWALGMFFPKLHILQELNKDFVCFVCYCCCCSILLWVSFFLTYLIVARSSLAMFTSVWYSFFIVPSIVTLFLMVGFRVSHNAIVIKKKIASFHVAVLAVIFYCYQLMMFYPRWGFVHFSSSMSLHKLQLFLHLIHSSGASSLPSTISRKFYYTAGGDFLFFSCRDFAFPWIFFSFYSIPFFTMSVFCVYFLCLFSYFVMLISYLLF